MTQARARPLSRYSADVPPGSGPCDHPDCDLGGEFRAPRSRTPDDGMFWFCLDHVREYNKAWDYFAGMDRDEIERLQREVVTWHRPTWPLGTNPYARPKQTPIDDPFDFLRAGNGELDARSGHEKNGGSGAPVIGPEQQQALDMLEIDATATLQQIKTRYKQLVKRYHPDANGSDLASEERLKQIIQAYDNLMSCGYS